MSTDNVVFRTVFKGYSKEDVNKYIEEMNVQFKMSSDDFERSLSSYKLKAEELEKLNSEKDDQLSELNKENESLKKSQSELKDTVQKKESDILALNNKINSLNKEISDKNDELEKINLSLADEKSNSDKIDEYRRKNDEQKLKIQLHEKTISENSDKISIYETQIKHLQSIIDEQNSKIKNLEIQLTENNNSNMNQEDELYKKSEMYDKISSQIGDILINANSTADSIINSAEAEAAKLRSDTENDAEKTKQYLSDLSDKIIESFDENIHSISDKCICDIVNTITDIQYLTNSLIDKINDKNQEISNYISNYKCSAHNIMREKINSIEIKSPEKSDLNTTIIDENITKDRQNICVNSKSKITKLG